MKKTFITISFILGITICTMAQNGGLFGMGPNRGESSYCTRNSDPLIDLPDSHGREDDANTTPLGSGIAVFLGFGVAYALRKRKVEN